MEMKMMRMVGIGAADGVDGGGGIGSSAHRPRAPAVASQPHSLRGLGLFRALFLGRGLFTWTRLSLRST